MKNVFIIGSRGYHYNYGGWETFVSNLVDNYNDPKTNFYISEYTDDSAKETYKATSNITVNPIYVKNTSSAKMFIYSVKALKYYYKYIKDNNITNAYIYILGLKLFNYLGIYKKRLKKLNVKIIVNPDGLEWKRSKWSYPVKKFFLMSEKLMLKNCDLIVCDALGIKEYVDSTYPKLASKTTTIAYGFNEIKLTDKEIKNTLDKYNLKEKEYFLVVGRCVPENNYELVINEFMNSNSKKTLLIITNLSGSKYYDELKERTHFEKDKRIRFIDGVYNTKELAAIRNKAYAYIHGHSVGGTNPSLIEALSLTELNILYDVCFNHDVGLDTCLYFLETGSLQKLFDDQKYLDESRKKLAPLAKKHVYDNYTWDKIINEYKKIFK